MADLTKEFLDMTYPDKYYKNVIEPAKMGKGPVPSKMQMVSRAQPFKAMRIGLDPYLPKSKKTGYDAFRAAPTGAVRTAVGSNIAYGLPFAYASGASALQKKLEEQGLTGKGGIYDIAGYDDPMSAGASVEYDFQNQRAQRFRRQHFMNRKKQQMQQRIRQAEAAEAAKQKAAADRQASLQAQVTTQANREAKQRVSRGEARDYGKTETRESSGWESSPFVKGGLVDLYRYGGFSG